MDSKEELKIMKKVFSSLLIVLFVFGTINRGLSQVTLTVDSLFVSEAMWLCQNDVVITHFAYGPHFNMCFSIKNTSKDTISVPAEKIHMNISYKHRRVRWKKETVIDLIKDSTLLIYPNSTISIRGHNFIMMDGVVSTGLNYRLVNFLPEIEKIINHSVVVLEIDGIGRATGIFKNCFTKTPFFVDGTFNESIHGPTNVK